MTWFHFIFDCENSISESQLLSFYFIILHFENNFARFYLQRSLTLKASYSDHVSLLSLGPLRKDSQEGHYVRSVLRTVRAELWKEGGKEKSWGRPELRCFSLIWCWSVYPVVCIEQRPRGRAFLLSEPFRLSLRMGTTITYGYGHSGSSNLRILIY